MTLLSFCYDNSKMKGKKNPIWTIIKEGSNSTENIYYNNQYFSYLFKDPGDYTISLQLEDTNGNLSKTEKKQIIKIV
jgi:PKD repeat protein